MTVTAAALSSAERPAGHVQGTGEGIALGLDPDLGHGRHEGQQVEELGKRDGGEQDDRPIGDRSGLSLDGARERRSHARSIGRAQPVVPRTSVMAGLHFEYRERRRPGRLWDDGRR